MTMLYCSIKYRNGYVQVRRMTKKDAWKMLKHDDIVQVIVYKNGRICADYIKARTY
jgi:5,10-methylene-tetrahydrofolate dehydrogenase/methenyl tetrahydrofolate cyclohydrolase